MNLLNIEEIRKDFPILSLEKKGKKIIYFDNAATSLKPRQVIEAADAYYKEYNANIHRGVHDMAVRASEEYEKAHEKVGKFINAKKDEVIFTRNTTESLNLLAYSFFSSGWLKSGDKILISKAEHHSNIVPWQQLEKRGVKLEYIELNDDLTLNLKDLSNKLNKNTKLVSLTQTANTTGIINPIKEISKQVKDNNSLFVVDGAQSVPHLKADVKKMNIDFIAFSGHKMLAPTGIGALYGRKELLEKMNPFMFGGDMIEHVYLHESTWNKLPEKFEAGTPNISGGIGFGAATEYLRKVGMENIEQREKELAKYLFEKLSGVKGVKVYGNTDTEKRLAVALFAAEKMDAHEVALALNELGNIAVRSGYHCAEPLISSISKKGLTRASLYFYNTKEEIDRFAETLSFIAKSFA